MTTKTIATKDRQSYFHGRCQEIIDILAKVHNARSAIVTEITDEGLVVRAASQNRENQRYVGEFIAYKANLFCFKVMDSKTPLFVENNVSESDGAIQPIAYFGYPVFYPDGQIFGTICIMEAAPSDEASKVKESIEKFKFILERELSRIN